MTDDHAAANRPHRIDNADHGLRAYAKATLLLKVGRVEVLRAVRHVIESGHQKSGVKEEPAVLPDECRQIQPRSGLAPIALPNRRLGNPCANVDDEQSRDRAGNEKSTPAEMR